MSRRIWRICRFPLSPSEGERAGERTPRTFNAHCAPERSTHKANKAARRPQIQHGATPQASNHQACPFPGLHKPSLVRTTAADMQWADFKKKWSQYKGKESSAYQEHFTDLCRLLNRAEERRG